MRDMHRQELPAGWRQTWETALFGDNHHLHAFARNSVSSHKVLAIREEQGKVMVALQPPSRRQVQVTLTLPHLSLDLCLAQMAQLALQQGQDIWAWLDQPLGTFFDTLDRMGLALWPRGMQGVNVVTAPATGLTPCPCTLTALLETGWLLELDPLLLLRMRGLSPQALQHRWRQQAQEKAHSDPHGQSANPLASAHDMAVAGEEQLRSDHFWGNARALRSYTLLHHPETAPAMPPVTMGAPQVESEEGQRFLARLLRDLYVQGGKFMHDTGD